LREDYSSLRITDGPIFEKPCQNGTNRATHAVSPRKTEGPAELAEVPNDAKRVQNSVKRVPIAPDLSP
jgi:hypothetical protein